MKKNIKYSMLIILIIVIIVLVLMQPIIPKNHEYSYTVNEIISFMKAIEMFYEDNHNYPSEKKWKELITKYLVNDISKDPWGNEYIYEIPGQGENPYEIISYGADGKPGGRGLNEDIYSWKLKFDK